MEAGPTAASAFSNSTDIFAVGGYSGAGTYEFPGNIDETFVTAATLSAEEIAEAYRAGRDHRLTKTITSTDLSAKTKLPFYVASDRPGTFMEATVGESAFANYEPDANTVGLWHLEEQTGAGAYLKDSSGNGYNGTPTNGPTIVQGKIGKAWNFDGTNDYVTVADNNGLTNSSKTLEAWVKLSALGTNDLIAGKAEEEWLTYSATDTSCASSKFGFAVANTTPTWACASSITSPVTGQWYHLVGTYDGTNIRLYVNGVLEGGPTAQTTSPNSTAPFDIGSYSGGATTYAVAAAIDEVRLSNSARTADEIRQAFEIGKRTHQITNDFVTTPQAAYSSGTSVTINNPYGTTNLTDTLNIGDTMIFKENVNGTETVSQ
ncbi:MAG: LamG domain-containing protein, partial [Bdellovibrionota bacterium]